MCVDFGVIYNVIIINNNNININNNINTDYVLNYFHVFFNIVIYIIYISRFSKLQCLII